MNIVPSPLDEVMLSKSLMAIPLLLTLCYAIIFILGAFIEKEVGLVG